MNDATHHIYVLRPARPEMLTSGPTEHETEVIGSHFSYLEELTRQGRVVLAGRTIDQGPATLGIVVLETGGVEARQIMERDPAVREGVMTAELIPFGLALLRE